MRAWLERVTARAVTSIDYDFHTHYHMKKNLYLKYFACIKRDACGHHMIYIILPGVLCKL